MQLEACNQHTAIVYYYGYTFGKETENGTILPTIIDKDTGEPLYNSGALTVQDIDGINFIYDKAYDTLVTPPLNVLRKLNIDIHRLVTKEGGDGCGEVEFQARYEVGPSWNWTPGKSNNPTNLFRTKTLRGKVLQPEEWSYRTTISANEQFVKIFIEIWEMDAFLCGGDDQVDINPINNNNHCAFLINAGDGSIWLAGNNYTNQKHYLGQVGEELIIEGYDNAPVRANFAFTIGLSD